MNTDSNIKLRQIEDLFQRVFGVPRMTERLTNVGLGRNTEWGESLLDFLFQVAAYIDTHSNNLRDVQWGEAFRHSLNPPGINGHAQWFFTDEDKFLDIRSDIPDEARRLYEWANIKVLTLQVLALRPLLTPIRHSINELNDLIMSRCINACECEDGEYVALALNAFGVCGDEESIEVFMPKLATALLADNEAWPTASHNEPSGGEGHGR